MPRQARVLLAVAWLLSACSADIPAPIHDDSFTLGGHHRSYRVLPGDTLYSIAFETGHDYRTLARWNHIPPPYRIEVGERIRLVPPPPAPAVLAGTGLGRLRLPRGRPFALAVPAPRPQPRPQPVTRPPTRAPRDQRFALRSAWIWPAAGTVKETFGTGPLSGRPGNRGIDIIGHLGEPVVAAAAGRVVYTGSGLPGYGKLIIIKQNNDYLSAYAHNAEIEVEEGAVVRQGQVIAAMGDSGTDRVELEFEIRLRGKPVNPIDYLPHKHH